MTEPEYRVYLGVASHDPGPTAFAVLFTKGRREMLRTSKVFEGSYDSALRHAYDYAARTLEGKGPAVYVSCREADGVPLRMMTWGTDNEPMRRVVNASYELVYQRRDLR